MIHWLENACVRSISALLTVSLTAIILALLGFDDLHAQGTTLLVNDIPRCGSCELTLTRITTIYDQEGTAGLSPPAPQDVLRTLAGKVVVITTNPFTPLLFDEHGGFLGRLGSDGEGPGEFRTPMSVNQGLGDTVWIHDSRLQRLSAWSSDGAYMGVDRRTSTVPSEAVVTRDGSWVFSGLVQTAASIGLPFHVVDDGGNVTLSFGPEVDVDPTGHPPFWIGRELAPAVDRGFWAAWPYEYKLEKYDLQGNLLRQLDRDADWFPETDPTAAWTLSEDGPRGGVAGLIEKEQGRLKTLVTLPGDDWREGLGERELVPGFEAAGVYQTPIHDFNKVYSFALEVIDGSRGALIYRERFAGLALGWVDDDHIATYRQDPLGIPIIEIYQVEFTGATERMGDPDGLPVRESRRRQR